MNQRLFFALFLIPVISQAQEIREISLDSIYSLAVRNYPSVKQNDLIRRSTSLGVENLQKNFLPQVTLSGLASYQSDVANVSVSLPGFNIPTPSKDHYSLVADITQLMYDGGMTKEQKAIEQLKATVETGKIDVELHQLKERINQLFLGALFLDEQLKQTALIEADLQTGIKRLEAQVQNGVAFRSGLNLLKAELLKATQREIELKSSRKGFTDALSQFTGITVTDKTVLVKPAVIIIDNKLTRPELSLFDAQRKLVQHQEKLINARSRPRASLFAQGGYAEPGLNVFKNEFDFYYIAGVRLNWPLNGFYTRKREKEQVSINSKIIELQEETFRLNTGALLTQQKAEIEKLEKLIETDKEIISLRRSVTESSKAQLENAVITANDYLTNVNAEDQARQMLIMHEVQLIQAKINYLSTAGK